MATQVHELKIWPQHYARVANGSKTFDIRDNDRGYQAGDKVIYREWDPKPINPGFDVPVGFTEAPHLEFKIGYVHNLGADKVVFSLLPMIVAKCDCQKVQAEKKTGEVKTKKAKSVNADY